MTIDWFGPDFTAGWVCGLVCFFIIFNLLRSK